MVAYDLCTLNRVQVTENQLCFFWFREFFNPHFFSVCVGLKLLIGSQGRVSQVPGTIFWQLQSRHCSASRIPLKIRFPVAGRRSKDGHHPDHQGVRILADVICFSWWNANRPWSAVVVKTALPKILKDLRRWHLEYVAFFCLAHAWWTECWCQFGGSSLSDKF